MSRTSRLHSVIRYDALRMEHDAARKDWNRTRWAKEAGVSTASITCFCAGVHQSPKMAAKLAKPLGRKASVYLLSVEAVR